MFITQIGGERRRGMRFPRVALCALHPISSLAFAPFSSPLLRPAAFSFPRVVVPVSAATPTFACSLTRRLWSVPAAVVGRRCTAADSVTTRGGVTTMQASSAASGEPRKVAALMYTYVDGMLDKRGPHRTGHLDLLKTMSEEGDCLLGGAFIEPCDGGIVLFSSPEKAQQFVDKDPYYTAGLVTSYKIRDYMAVVGTMMK